MGEVSFKASKQRDVPVFVSTENNEDRVAAALGAIPKTDAFESQSKLD